MSWQIATMCYRQRGSGNERGGVVPRRSTPTVSLSSPAQLLAGSVASVTSVTVTGDGPLPPSCS